MNLSTSSSSILLAAQMGLIGNLQGDFLSQLQNEAGETALFGGETHDVMRLASRALEGKVCTGQVADRVWKALAFDYGRSLLQTRVTLDGETVEIRSDEREFAAADVVDMFSFLQSMETALGGALLLTGHEGREIILRFPPLTHFERAARRVYGEDAAGWVYVRGEIPREDANRLHGHRRQHIALPLKPLYFGQAKRVIHPFPFAFHDLYHAIDVAGIHPELLKIGVALYDTLHDLPPELRGLPFVGIQFHELSELLHVKKMSLPNFLKWTFVPFETTVRRVHQILMPPDERNLLIERSRLYVDRVFQDWPLRLHEDRRPAVTAHRQTLDAVLRQVV